MNYKYFLFAIVLSFLSACSFASHSEKTKQDDTIVRVVPTFNPDSAYQYVKAQCDFGPRVPGTEAHTACLQYFVEQFSRFGVDTVIDLNNIKCDDILIIESENKKIYLQKYYG